MRKNTAISRRTCAVAAAGLVLSMSWVTPTAGATDAPDTSTRNTRVGWNPAFGGQTPNDRNVQRIELSADAAQPQRVDVGQPFVVVIDVGRSTSGFDGTLRFDTDALEFGGITATDPSATVLDNTGAIGGVGISVFDDDRRSTTGVEARFTAATAGQIDIVFDVFTVINDDGDAVEGPATLLASVQATNGSSSSARVFDAPPADTPDDESPTSKLPLDSDVTGDGVVDSLDLVELQIDWDEAVSTGTSCALSDSDAARLDINGDGCLGVEDFAAVSGKVTTNAPTALDAMPASTAGATFVVNTTADDDDTLGGDNQCLTALGECSLRAAIQQANITFGPNRIEFDIPGTGPHTIVLNDRLTTISDATGPVTIDGYTQPGSSANTDPLVSNANIQIGVRPAVYVEGRPSFVISTGDNVLRGLAVYDSFHSFKLFGAAAVGNHIVGNFIGTDPTATFAASGQRHTDASGVGFATGASDNHVGTPALADRNVISGNKTWGIRLDHSATTGNIVQNNLFGFHPDGTATIESFGGIDVQFGTRDTVIGGRALHEHNVFAGHGYAALDFSHNSFTNRATGNLIGTDVNGAAQTWTGNDRGIFIKDDSRLNTIEENVIVNGRLDGIFNKQNYTGANNIIGNVIGLDLDGTPAGNGRYGISLRGHDDVIADNVIADNRVAGIWIDSENTGNGANDDENSERNRISQNSFFDNRSGGIDITAAGTNTNDPGDADVGPQGLLNHPELITSTDGSVTGTACAGCEVEVYLADTANAGWAQGRQYLGTALTDGAGAFQYDDARIVGGVALTALTIDALANTSEFAPAITPSGTAPTIAAPSIDPLADRIFVLGQSSLVTITAQPSGATFTALRLPPGLDIDQRTGAVSGTPSRIGTFPVTILVHNMAGVDAVDVLWSVGLGNAAPTVDDIEDQTSEVGAEVSLPVIAVDVNGDVLSYSAAGLPATLDIDEATGLISGTPTVTGPFDVTVTVSDGELDATTTFQWTIQSGFQCLVNGTTLSWTDQGTGTYHLRHLIGGNDLYIGSTTELSAAVQSQYGAYQVVTYTPERIVAQCDAPLGSQPAFVCTVDGDTVSWTDQSANSYSVRRIANGTNTYIGSTTATSYVLDSSFGQFEIRYKIGGTTFSTTCDGDTLPPFTCAVDGTGLVTWTDQQTGAYYVRRVLNGVNSYVGSSTDLDYQLTNTSGDIVVVTYLNRNRVAITCDQI